MSFKRLWKLEQQVGKYGERLINPSHNSKASTNKWVIDEIRTMLDRKMSAHSSKPELTQHFTELFSGLEHINSPPKPLEKNPLDPELDERGLMEAFDERYYRGLATFSYTTKVLSDKRVRDPQHLVRAVAQGGTILSSWTNFQRQLFSLHVANKLWSLNEREAARTRLRNDYHQFWFEKLTEDQLPDRDLRLLIRAVANTRSLPLSQLVTDLQANWRSLFVVWQNSFWRLGSECDTLALSDPHQLWPALNRVGYQLISPLVLPNYLKFVPRTSQSAGEQIRSALIHHAALKNDARLTKLLVRTEIPDETAIALA